MAVGSAQGADYYWTNTATGAGGNYTNSLNWLPNAVPGGADNANFTSNGNYRVNWTTDATVSNAFFNTTSGIITQAIGTATWFLTNSYIVGQNAGTTSTVTQVSGSLVVTNAAATANIIIGQTGRGTFNLGGGTVIANTLLVTNNTTTATNSVFTFTSGTLTTTNAAGAVASRLALVSNSTFAINGTWNMNGGSNLIVPVAVGANFGTVSIGNSANNNAVNVYTNAVWNLGGVALTIGSGSATGNVMTVNAGTVINAGTNIVGNGNSGGASGNGLLLTNGGAVMGGTGPVFVGNGNGGSNNWMVVTGTGSVLSNAANELRIGYFGSGNSLTISAGGKVYDSIGIIGWNNGFGSNSVLVTGANSLWNNSSTLTVGDGGASTYNSLTISNGALVVSGSGAIIGSFGGSCSNSALVTGSGSVWSNTSGTFAVGSAGSNNTLTIANSGTVYQAGGINVGASGAANNNSVLVTDTGSLLRVTGSLNFAITNNSLTVANGGAMVGTNIVMGGISNTMTVAGPGSSYTGSGSVLVGDTSGRGAGNSFYVTNGGRATLTTYLFYGTNNLIYLAGGGAVISNSTGTSIIGVSASSFNNKVRILDGATNWSRGIQVGGATGSSSNVLEVAGTGSALLLPGGAISVGAASGSFANGLYVTNGGTALSGGGDIGSLAGASNNFATVNGSGSVWSNTSGNFIVGNGGSSNTLTIANSGTVYQAGGAYIGNLGTANNNLVTVTDTGSVWRMTGRLIIAGSSSASGNALLITNGGAVYSAGGNSANVSGPGVAGSNNWVVVTGPNSVWIDTGYIGVGYGGTSNALTISAGAQVSSVGGVVGSSAGANSNAVLVTGSSSVWSNTSLFTVGSSGGNNSLVVSNGGTVYGDGLSVSSGVAASNNTVTITGARSLLAMANSASAVNVGSNATTKGVGGLVQVFDGGTLEANTLVAGLAVGGVGSGIISNSGGIYQFTANAPTITTNGPNAITINNGTISFRNVSNANVFANVAGVGNQISNIVFTGTNTFRLNASSNTATVAQDYTFNSSSGPTNYTRLEMVNGTTLWRGSRLTVATNGAMLVSNTVGTVNAVFTNLGYLEVANSTMTFGSNVVIQGRYRSDPSTNTFLGNVTLTSGGALAGGTGDRFEFGKSLFISNASNPSATFNLASSTVAFINGGRHTNAITGLDLGNDGTNGYPDGFTAVNFSYGRLKFGSTNDQVLFTKGGGAVSNALYVEWLDLGAFTNQFATVSNMVTSLLFAPTDINIYYMRSSYEPGNAFLLDQVYRLDNGFGSPGGFLMPAVPEPSSLLLIGLGCLAFLARRRRRP